MSKKSTDFPKIKLSGSPEEIGFSHGRQLTNRIKKVIEYYFRIFKMRESEIFEKARYFKKLIADFNPAYVTEIEAIAEGADLDSLWIYAINSRTEILSININECTSILFQATSILGQNWDFSDTLEQVSVLVELKKPDGHTILTITEPGIIGKIGMNSAGLGVCLNILRCGRPLNGVPIHIVLRSILDSKSISEARDKINTAGLGKSSNILVGDHNGRCFDFEFAGKEIFEVFPSNRVLIHTNHYLAKPLNHNRGSFQCSYARFITATNILNKLSNYSVQNMKTILLDRSNADFPIHRNYIPNPVLENMGTICTVIFDLKNLTMHIKKGNHIDKDFSHHSIK